MPERFRYAAVEAALASMFFIDASSMGAFRGRITNLRRFNVTPFAPKKGAPVEYAFSDIAILAYSLSLFEYGLDPASVQVFLSFTIDRVMPALLRDEKEDAILCFYANEMSRQFVENFGTKAVIAAVVIPSSQSSYEQVSKMFKPKLPEIAWPHTLFFGSRLCMMNLSHLRRLLIAELSPQDSSTNDSAIIRRRIEDAIEVIRASKRAQVQT